MEMFCNTNQFPSLPFWGPHTKPHGFRGSSKHYCMKFDPKIGHDIGAIHCIPCACAEYSYILDKPWIHGFSPQQQPFNGSVIPFLPSHWCWYGVLPYQRGLSVHPGPPGGKPVAGKPRARRKITLRSTGRPVRKHLDTVIWVELCSGSVSVLLETLPPGPFHSLGTKPTATDGGGKWVPPPSSKT